MVLLGVHWKEKKKFNFPYQTKFNLVREATVYDCDMVLVKYLKSNCPNMKVFSSEPLKIEDML